MASRASSLRAAENVIITVGAKPVTTAQNKEKADSPHLATLASWSTLLLERIDSTPNVSGGVLSGIMRGALDWGEGEAARMSAIRNEDTRGLPAALSPC